MIDEYGGIEGLVTLNDILKAIVGELPGPKEDDPMVVPRDDGSWLLDGRLSIADLRELLGLTAAEAEDLDEFQTVGGFVMGQSGRIPETGDRFDWSGWRFEVLDMDHRRVDKVLVARTEAAGPVPAG